LRKTGSALRVIDERYQDGRNPLAKLSLREHEVFDLVVRGFTTKKVAQELCISAKTVETHRTHINEKLAAHCSADLVRIAFQNGMTPSGIVVPPSQALRAAAGRAAENDGVHGVEGDAGGGAAIVPASL
jgi:DNA-binding CsgD family transcriptional regulator